MCSDLEIGQKYREIRRTMRKLDHDELDYDKTYGVSAWWD
jgi:hypothetical protein